MSSIAFVCFSEKLNVSIRDFFAVSGSFDPLMIDITLSIFSNAFFNPSNI